MSLLLGASHQTLGADGRNHYLLVPFGGRQMQRLFIDGADAGAVPRSATCLERSAPEASM